MMTIPWREFSSELFRSSETLQIIHAFFDEEDTMDHVNLLSEAENHRAARIKNKPNANKYIITHGILRRVLGSIVQAEPQTLSFSHNQHDKPFLSHPSETGVSFNLTHSGNVLLIALSKGATLGVDVEKLDLNIDFSVIRPLVFSPDEHGQYSRSSDPVCYFYTLWTAKEAVLKAAGCGFAISPTKLSIQINDGLAYLTTLPLELSPKKYWTLNTFQPAAGYIAAVAVFSI